VLTKRRRHSVSERPEWRLSEDTTMIDITMIEEQMKARPPV
jgi:hypothetical protein